MSTSNSSDQKMTVLRRCGADVIAGVRASVPVMRRIGLGTVDWLADIGWGKFLLLSILLLMLTGILGDLLFKGAAPISISIADDEAKLEHVDIGIPVTFILILAAALVKVALGSRKKAESRAQQATAAAVEESLKRQLAETRLKMLQAQVEPHFLFNTLASVEYLIETDPPRAAKMQKNLIQYLRAALPQMREGSTTLGKEVALCRSYLEIFKMRMEDRLQFAINVPQGLGSAQFPPMILQPLVENAIKHGLEPKADGGSLTLSADVSHGALRIVVADTGLGLGQSCQGGTGVGLSSVRERLAALYGGNARLLVENNAPAGTIVLVELPYRVDTDVIGQAREVAS